MQLAGDERSSQRDAGLGPIRLAELLATQEQVARPGGVDSRDQATRLGQEGERDPRLDAQLHQAGANQDRAEDGDGVEVMDRDRQAAFALDLDADRLVIAAEVGTGGEHVQGVELNVHGLIVFLEPDSTGRIGELGSKQGRGGNRSSKRLGEAMVMERTPATLGFDHGGRNRPRPEQGRESRDGLLGFGPEGVVERDNPAVLGLRVIDRPFGNGHAQRLFQAERLSAKLDVVVVPASFGSTLVLDGIRDFETRDPASLGVARPAKLDQIRPPIQPEPPRGDPQTPFGPDPLATLEAGGVGPLVERFAPAGMLVVDEQGVEVPERRATLAVQQGVQGRKGDKVVPLGIQIRGHTHPRSGRFGIDVLVERDAREPSFIEIHLDAIVDEGTGLAVGSF